MLLFKFDAHLNSCFELIFKVGAVWQASEIIV
ncbi:Uncharacterised protein [Yersinia enterocolitica]|nr:Uncharacterised protein [Yersinia enterocolitica]